MITDAEITVQRDHILDIDPKNHDREKPNNHGYRCDRVSEHLNPPIHMVTASIRSMDGRALS
jgi:hypothetical protein